MEALEEENKKYVRTLGTINAAMKSSEFKNE